MQLYFKLIQEFLISNNFLCRSKKYKRLQSDVNAKLNHSKQTASVSYSTVSHANATINAFKGAARGKPGTNVKIKMPGGRKGKTRS